MFRKKILLFIVTFLLLSSISLFAEERFVLSFNVDYLENIYKGQIAIAEKEKEIINMIDQLGVNIESKNRYETNTKIIDNISNEVIILGQMVLKNVRDSIPIRRGLDELVNEKELKQNRPFGYFATLDITEEIYDILEDAGVLKISSGDIKKRYKKQCDDFDKRLNDIITAHTALWIKDINSGKEYDQVIADYKKLATEILLFNAKIYNDELKNTTPAQIIKVKEFKSVEIKKMLAKRDQKIEKNQAKLKK